MKLGSMGISERMWVCVCGKETEMEWSVWEWELKDQNLWLPFAVTQRHTLTLKNPDYLLSAESTGIVVPLWMLFLPVGSLWVSQWRPQEFPLLSLHQILLKPTNDWDYTVASSPSSRSINGIQQCPDSETKLAAPVIIIIITWYKKL